MTTIRRARLSLHLRALFGVLVVVMAMILLVGHPGITFAWIEDHRFLDFIIAAIGAAFHLWNTYQDKIVVP